MYTIWVIKMGPVGIVVTSSRVSEMVLGFKKQFVSKIISGSKIHTIRVDEHKRWKVGNIIHFATGVRTKAYKNFKEGHCLGVQKIEFKYVMYNDRIPVILVDDIVLTTPEVELLANNDGFDTVDKLYAWFNSDFKGKIIHWTDFKY